MQRKLVLSEHLDALLTNVWAFGRRELWKDVWETFGLQDFDRFYPEDVAVVQTEIQVLQALLAMEALEQQLAAVQSPPSPFAVQGGAGGGAPGTPQLPVGGDFFGTAALSPTTQPAAGGF